MNISISREGVEIGEWTEAEIRGFYNEGRLVATDYYWKEGMTEWAELSKLIKPPPPFPTLPSQPPQLSAEPSTQPTAIKTPKYRGIGRLLYVGLIVLQWIVVAIMGYCLGRVFKIKNVTSEDILWRSSASKNYVR